MDRGHFAVLASPRRQEILRLVWDDEQSAGAIHQSMPDITFGAVSQQLRALKGAGFVDLRAEQQRRYYRARREALMPIAGFLEGIWSNALTRLKFVAELEQARRGPRPGHRRPNRKTTPRKKGPTT